MRNLLLSLTALTCLSAPVSAMDFRADLDGSLYHLAGWDQDNLEAQTQGSVYLRAQIEKLQKENEQLLHIIHKLRTEGDFTGVQGEMPKKHDSRVQALVEENKRLNKLLKQAEKDAQNKQASSQADIYARRVYELEEERNKLEDENKKLVKQYADIASMNKHKGMANSNELKQRDAQIESLKGAMGELQTENRKLSSALADATNNVISYQGDTNDLQKANISHLEKIAKLEQELSVLTRKNDDLRDEVAAKSEGLSASVKKQLAELEDQLSVLSGENESLREQVASKQDGLSNTAKKEIAQLQQQNKSLAETIKAQNKVLLSNDNAVQAAERLITENKSLTLELAQAKTASGQNNEAAKELVARNNNLIKDIKQRDLYIAQLEGLKDTVKQLRMENDKYALGQVVHPDAVKQIKELQGQNNDLRDEVDKQKSAAVEYRKLIADYQNNADNNVHKASYEKEIDALKDEVQNALGQLTDLRLENETLKEQVKNLHAQKQATNSVVFERHDEEMAERKISETQSYGKVSAGRDILNIEPLNTDIEYIRGDHGDVDVLASGTKDIKYVDAPYPPVEQVKPLLNEDGSQIYASTQEPAAGVEDFGGMQAEDLLAQDLKPLSTK